MRELRGELGKHTCSWGVKWAANPALSTQKSVSRGIPPRRYLQAPLVIQFAELRSFSFSFFLKLMRCYGEAGCGGLARNSRAVACARVEHHRGASSEAPLRDYVVLGAICWTGAERQRPWPWRWSRSGGGLKQHLVISAGGWRWPAEAQRRRL